MVFSGMSREKLLKAVRNLPAFLAGKGLLTDHISIFLSVLKGYCSRVGHFGASHKGLLPSLSNFRRKSRRRKSNALRKKAFVLRAGVP
ncbi:MAG: hypothetical protein VZR02_06780, partial [Lachnospiraceae bacterium]|nr:hypothetical protein [Lachnospiraceae bacterium]